MTGSGRTLRVSHGAAMRAPGARLWHCTQMATRHSPSADTERPAPKARAGVALEEERPPLRAPRPMSWPSPLPVQRFSIPPPPAGAWPPTAHAPVAPVFERFSILRIPIGERLLPLLRSRRILWGAAAVATLTAGVLAASWVRSGRPSHVSALAGGSEEACSSLVARALASASPVGSPAGRGTSSTGACWASASEPPVVSVWELPAVPTRPPPAHKSGFGVPPAPATPRAIVATRAR